MVAEFWKQRYEMNYCTLKDIQDLYNIGDITEDEFVAITGKEPSTRIPLPNYKLDLQKQICDLEIKLMKMGW